MRGRSAKCGLVAILLLTPWSARAQTVDPGYLDLVSWRMVGPTRGGRVLAVAGHPDQEHTYFQGTAGGGVWKTEDGGLNWGNVSDGAFNTGSVGAIAVAESDPNVVYVGMGETCVRGNFSPFLPHAAAYP